MSNYYGNERTNYFKVAPEKKEAFKAWAEALDIEVADRDGRVAIFPHPDSEDGCFPSYSYAREEQAGEGNGEVDVITELSEFLAPGSVAVFLSVGNEKLRYLHGHADAIDHTGKLVTVSINDIYHRAAEAFPNAEVTEAAY